MAYRRSVPARHPLNAVLVLLTLLVAGVHWRNPVDSLARGKWVRLFDTVTSVESGIICIPAYSWDEVPGYTERLPEVVSTLRELGVAGVAIHLPMAVLDEPTLREAAGTTPLVLASDAHIDMRRSLPPKMNLGPLREGNAMAYVLWEQVKGTPHAWVGTADHGLFMPVHIPFLHWDRQDEWATAAGHMVFIGACRVDRELTRYGRQPAVVAHGEVVETFVEGRFPRYAPLGVDLALALLTLVGSFVARRKHALAPIAVGLVALAAVMGGSLTLWWFGWSGVVVGAICGAFMRD